MMRKFCTMICRIWFFLLLSSMLFSSAYASDQAGQPVSDELLVVELFYKDGCNECNHVKEGILSEAQQQFAGQCNFIMRNSADPDNYLRLSAMQEFFHDYSNAPVYVSIGENLILSGRDAIENQLIPEIQEQLQDPREPTFVFDREAADLLTSRFRRFTLLTVVIAGLIDGINPCVFATLVFFISILAISKTTGGRLLRVGCVYCLSCFLTYVGIGFGLFGFLDFLNQIAFFRLFLEWAMVLLLLAFAIISFYDAWKFRRTHQADAVLLRLPEKLKQKIHKILKNGNASKHMLWGIFGVGILVTLIESVCTGQVYLPTLVFLTKTKGAGLWVFYLLIYNIAFIIPLLIVFYAVWRGVNTKGLVQWSLHHVVISKILLGLFFIVLCIVFLFI